jgi:type IV pilus assembly protein PilY1
MKVVKTFIICALFIVSLNQPSFAHDTDLYAAAGTGIEPNILILFDNSGSMADYVPSVFYSNAVTYDPVVVPTANRDTVYRKSWNNFYFFANSIADVACDAARAQLTTTGHYTGMTGADCHAGSSRTLWTGNYRNYIATTNAGEPEQKIVIAKTVMTDFLNAINGVRVGAFIFNYEQGGRLQTSVKSFTDPGRAQLISDFNAITPETWTPLAETLYEIGLYFKGAPGFFNSGVNYTSPIQYSCQKNYVIIITDGNSTHDRDSVLRDGATVGGYVYPAIGDRDGDQREPSS